MKRIVCILSFFCIMASFTWALMHCNEFQTYGMLIQVYRTGVSGQVRSVKIGIITCICRSPATLYSQAQLPTTVISKKTVVRTVSCSQPQLYIAMINREDSDGAGYCRAATFQQLPPRQLSIVSTYQSIGCVIIIMAIVLLEGGELIVGRIDVHRKLPCSDKQH